MYDFENMPLCSHLKAKLAPDGEYYELAMLFLRHREFTCKPISKQLHIYYNGKKFFIFTGKSGIKRVIDGKKIDVTDLWRETKEKEKDDATNPKPPGGIWVNEKGALCLYDYLNYRLSKEFGDSLIS